jgi:formylglycine-generating enzyme required for sulfatase activity
MTAARWMIGTVACLILPQAVAGASAQVTLKGNVLCNRATDIRPWNWDPKDGDHTPIIYAMEGTPEVDRRVRTIMEGYPDQGLDTAAAIKIQERLGEQVKYYLAPGPIAASIHKKVEAGTRLLALTGTLTEHDGKKWITVSSYAPAKVIYPARMLAPDRPFKPAGKQRLRLKVGPKLTLECILLPAGSFLQGSPFYQRRYQDEYPHEVVLTRPFFMSEVPITQEMFEAVMGKNPSRSKGPDFPVEHMPLADILEFCKRLSEQNKLTVRLPTDAEWEYAARVGTSNPCFSEKYADQISETGGKPNHTPVRTKRPNAWGLYDMLCGGWHVTGDYKADNVRVCQVDPKGPDAGDKTVHGDATGKLHKTRGGWHYDHMRPNMHGAATDVGTIWEGGSPIFRVVVEAGPGS